jgi:methionine synthase I (cobalamin-dependent)
MLLKQLLYPILMSDILYLTRDQIGSRFALTYISRHGNVNVTTSESAFKKAIDAYNGEGPSVVILEDMQEKESITRCYAYLRKVQGEEATTPVLFHSSQRKENLTTALQGKITESEFHYLQKNECFIQLQQFLNKKRN